MEPPITTDYAMPESRDAVIREIASLERRLLDHGPLQAADSQRLTALQEELRNWPTVDDLSKRGYVRRDAAAPELLEELYRALPFIEDLANDPTYKPGKVGIRIKAIRAAIAKAEGGEE